MLRDGGPWEAYVRIVRLFMALLVAVTGSVAVGAPLAHAAGATVSGYVITPQGTAGAGATVEVDGVAAVQADEFGAFTTPELAPGEHQLRAVSQDSAPSEVLTVTIVDGENQAGYSLILQPFGGTLSSRARRRRSSPCR